MASAGIGKRLQHRVSIDASMGEVYEWLASLDVATRSREVLYLVRLGAEIHLGRRSVQLAVGGDLRLQIPEERRPTIATPPSGDDGVVASTVASRMAGWDLGAICTPPARASK
ncbi:hypothetical protein FN976_16965 [Caenimonas sedimenti]|uniref:Uncharacterized protein n=1 Tax=Caenimonas sedimenti TaxID=2596921 RepID=A0A562ZN64_9BURK|nr:hypothetical protein [Caenimonas sedimenti]TWO70032.1 hypothetical protein FN976_16965 [Caenimonas sedimenti]